MSIHLVGPGFSCSGLVSIATPVQAFKIFCQSFLFFRNTLPGMMVFAKPADLLWLRNIQVLKMLDLIGGSWSAI